MIDDKKIDKMAEDLTDIAQEEADGLPWGKLYHLYFDYLKKELSELEIKK